MSKTSAIILSAPFLLLLLATVEIESFSTSSPSFLTTERCNSRPQQTLPFLFVPSSSHRRPYHDRYRYHCRSSLCSAPSDTDVDDDDAQLLLESVSLEHLQTLCAQYSISIDEGANKAELFSKLREHAARQADLEKQRRLDRLDRAKEEGVDVSEVSEEELEEEAFFYYAAPGSSNSSSTADDSKAESDDGQGKKDKGVRVVTVYDSRDTNDLTGFNMGSTPGQAWTNAATTLGNIESSGKTTTKYMNNMKNNNNNVAPPTDEELEKAQEQCTLILQSLLSRTGLPGFLQLDDDEDDDDDDDDAPPPPTTTRYTPFDPSTVPQSLLTQYTPALVSHKLSALQAALDTVELNAIGHDGMAADDVAKGGGHYAEVRKVGAFLTGYGTAQLRKGSQDVVSTLLDALVRGGVRELDRALGTMVEARQIDDALVTYLGDLVREQEKRVESLRGGGGGRVEKKKTKTDSGPLSSQEDLLSEVNDAIIEWNVTRDADGNIIEETIDPNDPKVREALLQATSDNMAAPNNKNALIQQQQQQPAQQQILTMLKLLRERVKAEAAFFKGNTKSDDREHGMNLRLLAYCLQINSDEEREQMLSEEVGSTLDRLEAFGELVRSSILYAESTSYQLSPGVGSAGSAGTTMNLSLLKTIEGQVQRMREVQKFQASGGSTVSNNALSRNGNIFGDDGEDDGVTSWE